MSSLQTLTLILTAACNLRCTYCYQSDKKSRRMDWSIAESAIERLLASSRSEVSLLFIGGEPLIEFPMIRRAVEYADYRKPEWMQVQYAISTNGLLLGDEQIEFLGRHKFDVQISFDGVPGAQRVRGEHTFEPLDRLLDKLRAVAPGIYDHRLRVSITLTPQTVQYLPESIDYFIRLKRVRDITVAPAATAMPDWRPDRIEELDTAFASIFEISLRHFEKTGLVPLQAFRKFEGSTPDERPPSSTRPMCRIGASHLDELVVDVDGVAHGCVMFADSYQTFPTVFLKSRAEALRLGRVDDPRLDERIERFPMFAKKAEIFTDKQGKHSSYRRCSECEYLTECVVCPMSIGRDGDSDPQRVPDFHCAFSMVSLKYRALFPRALTLAEIIRGRTLRPSPSTPPGASSTSLN